MMLTSDLVKSPKNKPKNPRQIWPKQHFSTKSHPHTKTCPQPWFADLLDLVKHTKYALKQQLGGPRDALLCISEAVFTSVFEWRCWQVHCSTSTVAYKRSSCINSSAAWPRQSSMHSPRIYSCPRLVSVIARRNCSRASCSAGKLASICRDQQRVPKDLRCGCCSLRVLELHSSGHQSQRECLVSFGRRKACDLKQFAWGS